MTEPTTNLQNLRDIIVPEPPPLWPPAPGVWVVLIMVVTVVLALFLWWRRARARSAYRRAGLALLTGARTAHDINVILKRVALAAFSRPQVAPLYGEDWVVFLDRTCPRARFATIGSADPGAEVGTDLRTLAGTWIRHHRVSAGGAQAGKS